MPRPYRWPIVAGVMLLPVLYWLSLYPVTYAEFRWTQPPLRGVGQEWWRGYFAPSDWLADRWEWYGTVTEGWTMPAALKGIRDSR